MRSLVVATRNRHKADEIKKILKSFPVRVMTLDSFRNVPEVVEDGKTCEYNAAKKARIVSKHTGRLTISDDSGLMVDALKGKPGVKSARFAGAKATYLDNNLKLLNDLGGVPLKRRTARFVCAIAIADRGKVLRTLTGVARGTIGFVMKGDEGFGYDSVFILPCRNKTFAEISGDEKNRISHRFKALVKARKVLRNMLFE